MNVLKILVAEDNQLHAARIEMLLDEMGYEMIGPFTEEAEILRVFKATMPDLALLDIHLKDSVDGIEIARKLNLVKETPVIFTTSFEDKDTINRALATDPYAYLVKPVEKGSLQAAIELAFHKYSQAKNKSQQLPEAQGWTNDVLIQDAFFVKAGDKLVKLSVADILWIEVAEDRYCDIVTADRRYHLRTSLNNLEEKLGTVLFFRTHRTCIVNLSRIDSINDAEYTISIGGTTVPLGKAFKGALFKRLKTLQ